MDTLRVSARTLYFRHKSYACAVGRGGIIQASEKREGDGATPAGTWALRACWYRPDRLPAPQTRLPVHALEPGDGWCDDPAGPAYNRPVKLPLSANHEILWREDNIYDVIVPLGYNDDPVLPGLGSAIFLHVARPDYASTEGCIALALPGLLEVLKECGPETKMAIERE